MINNYKIITEKITQRKNSGSYIIIFWLNKSQQIQIGKLGLFLFKKGYYVYFGSGLKNLKQRVKRHLTKRIQSGKRIALKWHIDYLSVKCEPEWSYIINDGKNYECKFSDIFRKMNLFEAVKGFGSSDCKCFSHLFYIEKKQDWKEYIFNVLNK